MRKTKSDIEHYINLVNSMQPQQVKLCRANGTNYINNVSNDTIFQGTKTECYYFLLGLSRIL